MPQKNYRKCWVKGICWIKDCLYSKTSKSYKAPDGRRLEPRRQVLLFRFPPEPERFEKWIEAVGPMLLDKPPGRLCKHHFSKTDFINDDEFVRPVLGRSAVPSLSHDYPRRPPDPVPKKFKPTNKMKTSETEPESKRKSPTPNMKKFLGLADEDLGEYDSDTDVDEIVESELGFKLQREEEDYNMLSDDDGDDLHPVIEEFDDDTSDEEVQMELIKLMAKKARGASPPPSPPFVDDGSPPPGSPTDSRSPGPSASQEDDTSKLFRSFELIYRSLQPEVQLVTKENLLGVMKIAKKMDDDLRTNSRLVLKPRVFTCSGNKR